MNLFRDFFLGFVRIHILHHAAQEPIYGLAMIEELKRHGYELSPGTLYPILHQLQANGYLALLPQTGVQDKIPQDNGTLITARGRGRKYYVITTDGRKALAEVQGKIRELGDEVLLGKGPTSINTQDDG